MYTPTPDVAAQAFDLGNPVGELNLIRRGDTDTWRLDTDRGSFLIKGYWPTTGGQFVAGELSDQLEVAMAFERRALEAGIDMAEPIPPVDPFLGWVTRINGRLFRAFGWIEHRPLGPDDDIADWLGPTLAHIHRLNPLNRVGLPAWWRGSIWPRVIWDERFAEGRRRNKPWSDLGPEALPYILDITTRIERLCAVAPDCVMTHGDIKAHNMLLAPTGPVLVDWDSVRSDSAALETGRIAYTFGEPIGKILCAYVEAGGDIRWAGRDLFLGVARHDVQGLFLRIAVSLDEIPAPRWMGDLQETDRTIAETLRDLPGRVEHLDYLASKVGDIGSR